MWTFVHPKVWHAGAFLIRGNLIIPKIGRLPLSDLVNREVSLFWSHKGCHVWVHVDQNMARVVKKVRIQPWGEVHAYTFILFYESYHQFYWQELIERCEITSNVLWWKYFRAGTYIVHIYVKPRWCVLIFCILRFVSPIIVSKVWEQQLTDRPGGKH